MYIILNWWAANHLVNVTTEEDGTPLYFESPKAAGKYVEENLGGEYQIVEVRPASVTSSAE